MSEDMPVISGDRTTILGNLLTSMIGASLLGIIVLLSGTRLYAEPIPESAFGPLAAVANAILFVVLATVGATLVVLLLKYGCFAAVFDFHHGVIIVDAFSEILRFPSPCKGYFNISAPS